MIAYIIYLILKGFSFFINLLPEGFALWLGRQLGNGDVLPGSGTSKGSPSESLTSLLVRRNQKGDASDCQEDLPKPGNDDH